eukprot:gb/GECG01005607.1/.p1 GENE.gb/GECG01005607.1/~~gb/GECG01005607.1/.p1  ORF type:complete len:521 (+),score=46.70 gb/GECG01005607.1/:1-1563(+)
MSSSTREDEESHQQSESSYGLYRGDTEESEADRRRVESLTSEIDFPASNEEEREEGKSWRSHVVWILRMGILLGIVYAALFFIFQDDVLPRGAGFAPLLLILCSEMAGRALQHTILPPLLGMTVVGIVLQNLPGEPLEGLRDSWASVLRSIALTLILFRGGLGLDLSKLRSLGITVPLLTVCPQLVEAAVVTVLVNVLIGLPWLWALLTGFIVGAVSPAVVVPLLLNLKGKGYGTNRGIPTLILAAAGVEDVVGISFIGIFLAIIFSSGSLAVNIIHGPAEVIGGAIAGIVLGCLSRPLEHSDQHYRRIVIPLVAITVNLLSRHLGFSGAGPLAAMAYGASISYFARKEAFVEEIQAFVKPMWRVFEPLLFGLVGASISFDQLKGSTIGFAVGIVFISGLFRFATAYTVQGFSSFSWKERLFVSVAWIPKATVQAAMGPLALDIARKDGDAGDRDLARDVLAVAVVGIVITAPLGAVAIQFFAPKLLTRDTSDAEQENSVKNDGPVDAATSVRINGSGNG